MPELAGQQVITNRRSQAPVPAIIVNPNLMLFIRNHKENDNKSRL